jgi:epoxide hydrolase 4
MDNDHLLEPGWRSSRVHANGLNFHVVEAGPEDADPLFLLHGFPEFWWAWRKLIPPLAAAGYRVIAPDLRGYNLSDAPRGIAAYWLDLLAADITGIAGALGLSTFHLTGHDWGGIVAWWVAARHADRVRRLVILDAPHPDVFGTSVLRHPSQALRSAYVGFFQARWLPETFLGAFDFAALRRSLRRSARAGAFEAETLDHYAAAWRRPGRFTAMLNYYRALRFRRSAGSTTVAAPTLMLWGERDSFLEPYLARASLHHCKAGRLEIVPQTTHWIHLEAPDYVAARIIEHVQRNV